MNIQRSFYVNSVLPNLERQYLCSDLMVYIERIENDEKIVHGRWGLEEKNNEVQHARPIDLKISNTWFKKSDEKSSYLRKRKE